MAALKRPGSKDKDLKTRSKSKSPSSPVALSLPKLSFSGLLNKAPQPREKLDI